MHKVSHIKYTVSVFINIVTYYDIRFAFVAKMLGATTFMGAPMKRFYLHVYCSHLKSFCLFYAAMLVLLCCETKLRLIVTFLGVKVDIQ